MMKINNLTVSYADKKVLDGLTLELPDGIICLMGESGCGKTTLLHTIAGLLTPQGGEITGKPEKIAVMFQEDRLFPWMNALQNIEVVCNDSGKALELLKAVELENDAAKKPDELSGGMKRRIALARTLAYDADLYIFDEPFKGLDPGLVERMAGLIKNLKRNAIVASHSGQEAELLGAEIIRLKKAL